MSYSEEYYMEHMATEAERRVYFKKAKADKLAEIERSEVGMRFRVQGNGASRRAIVEQFTCDSHGRLVRRVGLVWGVPSKRKWVHPANRKHSRDAHKHAWYHRKPTVNA